LLPKTLSSPEYGLSLNDFAPLAHPDEPQLLGIKHFVIIRLLIK